MTPVSTSDVYRLLSEPFGVEDLKADTSRGFPLTSINAQSIKDRLNTVIGWDAWAQECEFTQGDLGVLAHSKLYIIGRDRPVESEGYSDFNIKDGQFKPNAVGDAYKSARTDALSKAASCIGIGNEVFMGKVCPYWVMASKKQPAFLKGYFDAKEKWGGAFEATIGAVEKQQGGKWPKGFQKWNMKDMTALLSFDWSTKK